MHTDEDVSGALATAARLQALAMGQTPSYVLSEEDRATADRLTERGRHLPPRKPFLRADLTAGGAAAHGTWIVRQRGVSRERRSQASQKTRSARAPSRRSSDDPHPLARVRGFAAASTRMVVHLERRRAAMRLA